jgi:TolA-binding protein
VVLPEVKATNKVDDAQPPTQNIEELEVLDELKERDEPSTPKTKLSTSRSAASAKDPLALELAAIDQARGALARGDHALASRLLDRYAARFPKPRLGAEALVLRIETQVASGNRASAERLGKAFLKRNPNSPYARRVRSLIGDRATTTDP